VHKILIIESDPGERDELAHALTAARYEVFTASDGSLGWRAFYACHPHLILLALMPPQMDGWTLLQRLREVADVPVLIISRTNSLGDRLRAFQLGAQDFISKPFNSEEVVLRVKNVANRCLDHERPRQVYDDGMLRIDARRREVTLKGQPLPVTHQEMSLLARLAQQPNQLILHEDLLSDLPWLAGEGNCVALRSLLYRLRSKLRTASPGHEYITSQHGLGLRLCVPR
jgi:DNA-binding response OmpR family regulator